MYNLGLMLLSLMAAHNFRQHHCQLMTCGNDLGYALITLLCHTELQTQTYTLCLTGTTNTPSKVLREIKEQDP